SFVGGERVRGTTTVTLDYRTRQSQLFSHGKCNAVRPCLGQRQMISVGLLVAAGQWSVVGVADETNRYVLFATQIIESLADLSAEVFGDGNVLVVIPQRHNEISNAGPRRIPVPVSHLADGFYSADLDALDVISFTRIVSPFPECLVSGQMS